MKIRMGFSTASCGVTYIATREQLVSYLRRHGWQKQNHPNTNILVFNGPPDDLGAPLKLVIPVSANDADLAESLESAMDLLAEIEGRTIDSVRASIQNQSHDILRQRIFGNSSLTNLSLEKAPRIVKHMRDLVYYSACVEESPQPFFPKGRKIGKELTRKCRFGHTFAGSYGMTLEMPIVPNPQTTLSDDYENPPFERRVMQRIIRGLVAIERGAAEADVAVLTDSIKRGFNANLYEVMLDLLDELDDYSLEYSVSWSGEYRTESDLTEISQIRLVPSTVMPFIDSAARSLRQSKESHEVVIRGSIVQLRAESVDPDDEEDEEECRERVVTVRWQMPSGQYGNVRLPLSVEDYRTACDAHRDNATVQARGRLEKLGKYWYLTSATEFLVTSGSPDDQS